MRVLLVINGLGTGGAERSTAELLPHLESVGIHPTVACFHRRQEGVQDNVLRAGFDVRFIEGGLTSRVTGLRRLIREVGPDLVHTAIFEADLAGRLAAASGPPVLVSLVNTSYATTRSDDPNVRPWRLQGARQLERQLVRVTAHFHAITEAVRQSAIDSLDIPPHQITVVPRGRDASRLGVRSAERRQRVRADLGIDGDTSVLVTVGRQEYQKGQAHLIEALPRVVQERPNLVLLLAGRQGRASAALRALVTDADLDAHVRFLGHRDDVPDLLAASDLFVFPSVYEGLGGALLEAMALGLPTVASDLPALREVTDGGRCAALVPPTDHVSLADSVLRLLDDHRRADALGRVAQVRFCEQYSAARCHAAMVELYTRVAAQGSRGRDGTRQMSLGRGRHC